MNGSKLIFESGQIVRVKPAWVGFAVTNKELNHWLHIRGKDMFLFERMPGCQDGQLTKLFASNPSNAGPYVLPHEVESRFRLADLDER